MQSRKRGTLSIRVFLVLISGSHCALVHGSRALLRGWLLETHTRRQSLFSSPWYPVGKKNLLEYGISLINLSPRYLVVRQRGGFQMY